MGVAPGSDHAAAPSKKYSETLPPGVNRHAAEQLEARGVAVTAIVRVGCDSILYLGSNRRPMTAWIAYTHGRLDLAYEAGFPAEPSGWVSRRLWPAGFPSDLSRTAATRDLNAEQPESD